MLRPKSSRHRWSRTAQLYALLLSATALVAACDDDLDELDQDDVESRAFMVKPYPGGGGCEGCGATDELSNGGDYDAMMTKPVEPEESDAGEDAPPETRGDAEGREPGTAECDLAAQNCPEGEKCTAWADDGGSVWNSTMCSPIAAEPARPGETCTAEGGGVGGVDSCDRSSMCWDVDAETGEGVCVSLCAGTSGRESACDPGFTCSIFNGGALTLCLPECDPQLRDCGGDDLCVPSAGGFGCVLNASDGGGDYGDPCEHANACASGLFCLNAALFAGCEGAGCCAPFCDTDERGACPGPDQECMPWYEEDAPPGAESLGVCGLRR